MTTLTLADLAAARQMAAQIDQTLTLEGWIETETQTLRGAEAAAVEAQCRALWEESEETSLDIVPASDLRHGDTFRTLDRAGDYVLVGSVSELIACDEHEDAGKTIWKQVGEGEDAHRRDTGARGK